MLLIVALSATLLRADTADLIVTNARIYTADPAKPTVTTLAVKAGRIAEGLTKGLSTQVIDAKGATVVPGLIDSHVHMANLGFQIETFDFRNTKTVGEIAGKVRGASQSRAKGEWIRGRSWDQTNWGGQFPTSAPLTEAAPDHPVFLTRVDGHAGWANRKALELAGLTRDTPDPPGGKIIHDGKGEPTGVLIDRAQGLVTRMIPASTDEQVMRRIAAAAKECARLGLTSVHDAGAGEQELRAYRKLIAEGRLPVRVYMMIGGEGALWRDYLKRGPEIGERLTVRSIKLMADGAMGSRGAAFFQPYGDDPGNTGLMMLTRADIERVAREAVQQGFQVNTHAIGDRANRTVLEAYGAALKGDNDKRFRIEHAQAVSLPDFALFKKFDVIASIQSTHATSDMRWAEARLGPDRVLGAYAPKRFLKAGVRIANGSDFPVEEPDPLLGFYAAITRQDASGEPKGGWYPEQRLTREETLASWTVGGAYAAFEEKWKGTLTAGKAADFLILSGDIMTLPPPQILKVKVVRTVLNGQTVFAQ